VAAYSYIVSFVVGKRIFFNLFFKNEIRHISRTFIESIAVIFYEKLTIQGALDTHLHRVNESSVVSSSSSSRDGHLLQRTPASISHTDHRSNNNSIIFEMLTTAIGSICVKEEEFLSARFLTKEK
jgi:hypothetical protein